MKPDCQVVSWQMLTSLLFLTVLSTMTQAESPDSVAVDGKYEGTAAVVEVLPENSGDGNSISAWFAKGVSAPVTVTVSTTDDRQKKFSLAAGDGSLSPSYALPCQYAPKSGELTGKQQQRWDAATLELELMNTFATFENSETARERYCVITGNLKITDVKAKEGEAKSIRMRFSVKSNKAFPPSDDDPRDAPQYGKDSGASFVSMSREVEIWRFTKSGWEPAEFAHSKSKILVGDRIVVGENSNCVISFSDHSSLIIRPSEGQDQGIVEIAAPPEQGTQIDLLKGRLWVNIQKIVRGESIEVKSHHAIVGTKGTKFVVEAAAGQTGCKVIDGEVVVTHRVSGVKTNVTAGQQIKVTPSGLGTVEPFNVDEENKEWSLSPENASPPPTKTTTHYQHPAGIFELPLPAGWKVIPGMRNKLADRGFDSLKDESGQFVIIVRRQVDSADKPDVLLHRWMISVLKTDLSLLDPKFNNLRVSRIKLEQLAGLRLTYQLQTQQVVSRMAFVHDGKWCIINTVSPQDYGTAELPPKIMEILGKLRVPPHNPATDNIVTFPSGPGKQLAKYETIDGLTRDFGITVYERGVVVRDHVHGVEQIVPVIGVGFPLMPGSEGFLNRQPEVIKALGQPLTPEVTLFNYRLGIQVFAGGVVVHDPSESLLWQSTHAGRDSK